MSTLVWSLKIKDEAYRRLNEEAAKAGGPSVTAGDVIAEGLGWLCHALGEGVDFEFCEYQEPLVARSELSN